MSLLEAKNISKRFSGNHAVNDVSLTIEKGDIIGLIGANGAGKTTFFNCLSGHYSKSGGKVIFDGKDITKLSPYKVCRLGMVRTFQIVKPFGNLTVLDNVMVGAYNKTKSYKEAKKTAEYYIEFVGLSDKSDTVVRDLNIGDGRKIEMARALATQPKLLLLDEVMAGLTPSESESVMQLIRKISASGITIIMIEHIMSALMALSDKVLVLDSGKTICYGTPDEVVNNEQVISSYLGIKKQA